MRDLKILQLLIFIFCFNHGKPLTDDQVGIYVKFLEMGWEDVATAYLNLCINKIITLEFSKDEK